MPPHPDTNNTERKFNLSPYIFCITYFVTRMGHRAYIHYDIHKINSGISQKYL